MDPVLEQNQENVQVNVPAEVVELMSNLQLEKTEAPVQQEEEKKEWT